MDLDAFLAAPNHRELLRNEDGSWSAEVAELDGVFASGDTLEEVGSNLDAAMELWFEVEVEAGREIPEPWGSRSCSGTLNLRLRKSLHERAARRAKIEGVSLNQYLVAAISAQLGAEAGADHSSARDRLAQTG